MENQNKMIFKNADNPLILHLHSSALQQLYSQKRHEDVEDEACNPGTMSSGHMTKCYSLNKTDVSKVFLLFTPLSIS